MPTWYGNVCRSGAVRRRSQPTTPEESAADLARRRADSEASRVPAGPSDSPLRPISAGLRVTGRRV